MIEDQPTQAAPGLLETILEMLSAGGPVVALLLVMSIGALAVILIKLWQFHSLRIGDRTAATQAVWLHRQGRHADAVASLQGAVNPVAQIVAMALRGHQKSLPAETVREEVLRAGSAHLMALREWLRPLEVIAGLAPLLGLFGTVLGMIAAFQQLEDAGNQVNPSVLSGGIWEALLTTAVGLAVAMPVVAVLNWLESRIERVAHDMEDAVTQVFTQDLSVGREAKVSEGRSVDEPRHFGQAFAGN